MADAAKPAPRVAGVSWAQRTDRLYLTIEVTDCSKPRIKLEKDGTFVFEGKAGRDQHLHELRLDLYGLVVNKQTARKKIIVGYSLTNRFYFGASLWLSREKVLPTIQRWLVVA